MGLGVVGFVVLAPLDPGELSPNPCRTRRRMSHPSKGAARVPSGQAHVNLGPHHTVKTNAYSSGSEGAPKVSQRKCLQSVKNAHGQVLILWLALAHAVSWVCAALGSLPMPMPSLSQSSCELLVQAGCLPLGAACVPHLVHRASLDYLCRHRAGLLMLLPDTQQLNIHRARHGSRPHAWHRHG